MDDIQIDATELAGVLSIPIDDPDLDVLTSLWSLYRSGLLQMQAELDESGITNWQGLDTR